MSEADRLSAGRASRWLKRRKGGAGEEGREGTRGIVTRERWEMIIHV